MTKTLTLAEHAVLHTLDRIGGGYGLQIVALAEQLAIGRSGWPTIRPSGIYVLLHRMQKKDFVRSDHVDPEPGERGPRRRVYFPTELGKRALRAQEAFEGVMAEG